VGVRNDRHPPGGVSLAAVLAALQPQLRLIALLRNPVDRMYSAYYYYGHYAQRYGADPDGFHKYAVLQITAYETCPATATRRECAVQGYGSAEQLTKGLYAMFLPDYFAAFPREQLLVMRSEAYGDDTEGGLRAAMAHIGLDAPPPEVWGRMVEGKRSNSRASNGSNRGGAAGEMRADTRALLNAFYRPFNEELAALLKDDGYLSWHLEEPQAAQ
jgi:N-acetylgalactosamine 4-sulfate 6-O-sulfotransferase